MPASGHQNHTTSPSASAPFVKGANHVHRIPSRVRDDREPPLWWDETARFIILIWVKREGKCFCKWDWTRNRQMERFARRAKSADAKPPRKKPNIPSSRQSR